ncbi:MAG: bifunctional oligoribonuclease/PAP phosphatase NrnA [Clostridia bacterium]|jgi:phosphoesterase RecJ-like protein|nr:bifunctional oligoribonuclease/PAP phosphatase NrnA [Clostridia bacterium]
MKAVEIMIDSLEEIKKCIEGKSSIAISAHVSPDGDAVGASCALGMALKKAGKKVNVFLEKYSDTFDVIPTGGLVSNTIPEGFEPDLYISVDCGDLKRIGDFGKVFEKCDSINIDHHKSNTHFGKLNYADEYATSASEIVYKLIKDWIPLDKDIASALYAGIIFDTGGLRHTSTKPETLNICADLMAFGFDFNKIYNKIFYTRKFEEAKIMGIALEHMERICGGKIVYSYATEEDIISCGTTSDGLSEIINYLKGIAGCECAVFIYAKEKDIYKVSMRSDDSVDVCKACMAFGGGGHVKASGCTIEGKLDKIIEDVLNEVKKQL